MFLLFVVVRGCDAVVGWVVERGFDNGWIFDEAGVRARAKCKDWS